MCFTALLLGILAGAVACLDNQDLHNFRRFLRRKTIKRAAVLFVAAAFCYVLDYFLIDHTVVNAEGTYDYMAISGCDEANPYATFFPWEVPLHRVLDWSYYLLTTYMMAKNLRFTCTKAMPSKGLLYVLFFFYKERAFLVLFTLYSSCFFLNFWLDIQQWYWLLIMNYIAILSKPRPPPEVHTYYYTSEVLRSQAGRKKRYKTVTRAIQLPVLQSQNGSFFSFAWKCLQLCIAGGLIGTGGLFSYLFGFERVLSFVHDTGIDLVVGWAEGFYESKESVLGKSLFGSFSWFKDQYKKFSASVGYPEIDTFMDDIETGCKHVSWITSCELVTAANNILNILVTVGWISTFDWKYNEVSIFKSESLRKEISAFDIIRAVGSFLKTFISCLLKFLVTWDITVFYADALKQKYEDDYTMLMSKKLLIETGRMDDMDCHEYDRILAETILKTRELIGNCKDGERTYYSKRFLDLKNLATHRTLAQRESIRMRPYAILAFGGSGVMKSSLTPAIARYILEVNGFDSAQRSVISINEFDKFQSEYRTYHNAVVFDDLCNGKPDQTEGNPVSKVIQFINNMPTSALNPNVDMKGNVMIEPKIVFGTTNLKHLNAGLYSVEPLSIVGRFNYTVTQKMRPEYCEEGSSKAQSSKITAAFGKSPYPDCCLFTVQKPFLDETAVGNSAIAYKNIVFEGKELVDIDLKTYLRFLKADSAEYYENQRIFVEGQRALKEIELDEEGLPVMLSQHTTDVLESQILGLDLSCPQFLLDYEERFFGYFEEKLNILAFSPFGYTFYAFYYYNEVLSFLKEHVWWYYKYALGFIFLNEFFGLPRTILWIVITHGFVVYQLVQFIREAHREVAPSWTTLPRLSTYIRSRMTNSDPTIRWGFISAIGGMASLAIVSRWFNRAKVLSTSQGAAPLKVSKFRVVTGPPEHPKWGSENQRLVEKDYKVFPSMPSDVKTMTYDQMITVVSKRQYFLEIEDDSGKISFCNAMPVDGNALLIPNHVIPKKTCKARLVRKGAHVKNVVIQPEACSKLENHDYALWSLPELGDNKSLINYFPTAIEQGKKFKAQIVYNNATTVKIYPEMLVERQARETTLGGKFEAVSYSFPGQTFQGLCMATLVSSNNKGEPFISGFHLGGDGSAGCAGFLTRDEIKAGLEKLNTLPGILSSHSASTFNTSACDIDITLSAPHELCPTRKLDNDAKCKIFGGHNQSRGSPSSEVRVSKISETVTAVTGMERLHGKPKDMGHKRHKDVDIENKTHPAYDFQGDSFVKAYEDYLETILEGLDQADYDSVGVLPIDAILAGVDGVQGINSMVFSTSAGFPFKGSKEQFVKKSDRHVEGISCPRDLDESILKEVDRLEEQLLKGERVNLVFKGALKDEATKLTKDKVRVFAGCNIAATFIIRKYFLTISSLMQKKKNLFECAVGINPCSPEWTEMMTHVYRFGIERIIAGDYKSFDGRMAARFMLGAFKILITIAEKSGNYDGDDLMAMKGLAAEISSPTYDYFGTLVQFFGSNPSGHPLTVVINSIVNSLYMRYAYYEIAKTTWWMSTPRFDKVVSLMTYGDDNIMSVKKGYDAYNHTSIAAVFAASGITYTMADKEAKSVPFVHGSTCGFLKRNAIWDDGMQLYRAPLEMDSIMKPLHAHIVSKVLTEEQHCAEALIGAADEIFEHGRESYEKMVPQLEEIARRENLLGYVGEFLSYDEQMDRYLYRHAWKIAPERGS